MRNVFVGVRAVCTRPVSYKEIGLAHKRINVMHDRIHALYRIGLGRGRGGNTFSSVKRWREEEKWSNERGADTAERDPFAR